ncbi:MAG TPA: cytochrome d ubiquinol oxidase subunit II, partial [Candidatus Eisenbacteria bacterium]
MPELWFAIVALMLTLYVVLDGFDLGAGSLHLAVARTDTERRQVLAAIGPFWDGNEVWLLATGGALFVAFPRALAAGLSGFYLAIFLVLWCLILRGIAIEFRSHVPHPLWRAFWDTTLALASALLAVFFGAALGNLVRGLPLDGQGWFGLALFTHFGTRPPVGILDWYTVAAGVFALATLMLHGATFLAMRATGALEARSRALARWLGIIVAAPWPPMTRGPPAGNPAQFHAVAAPGPAGGAAAH